MRQVDIKSWECIFSQSKAYTPPWLVSGHLAWWSLPNDLLSWWSFSAMSLAASFHSFTLQWKLDFIRKLRPTACVYPRVTTTYLPVPVPKTSHLPPPWDTFNYQRTSSRNLQPNIKRNRTEIQQPKFSKEPMLKRNQMDFYFKFSGTTPSLYAVLL